LSWTWGRSPLNGVDGLERGGKDGGQSAGIGNTGLCGVGPAPVSGPVPFI
jgi:hypothetical protein